MNVKVSEVLKAAAREVDEADIPDDLRVVAFSKAIDLLTATGPVHGMRAGDGAQAKSASMDSGDDELLRKIASKLGLDIEVVSEAYYFEDGELQLNIPAVRLDSRKAPAMKQLALLVAAGRQAAGLDDATPFGVIREVCDQYGRLDGPNFAGTIKQMNDVFIFKGSGQKQMVRMTRPGWERASDSVNTLVNGGAS